MTAHDIISDTERLPAEEQAKVAEHVASRLPARTGPEAPPRLRAKPFEEAMDRVFRQNGELLRRLAQ